MHRPTFILIVFLSLCFHIGHSQGIEIDSIIDEYSGVNIKYTGGSGIWVSSDEVISPGEVVGVREGKITLNTDNADRLMVITDRPAIIGNHKAEVDDSFTQNVSFLGQVPVRIIGPVASGDWIIPSAEHNGTAKAVATSDLNYSDVIIGQAWETNQSNKEKLVNVIVGVDQSKALHTLLKSLSTKYDILNEKILKQEQVIKTLEFKIESLIK